MEFLSFIVSGLVKPITDLASTWINKKEDTKVAVDKNDVSVIESRNTLLGQIHNDPAIAVGWYLFIVPTGVWYAAIVLYCLVHPWFPVYKVVLGLPDNILYIPYAVVAFLFGLSWRGRQ